MKTASVEEVKSRLGTVLKATEEGPVVVTRDGRPVAVLVGVQDEAELERLVMAYSPRLREILNLSRQQIREGQGVPHDEFWADIEERKSPPGAARPRRKKA